MQTYFKQLETFVHEHGESIEDASNVVYQSPPLQVSDVLNKLPLTVERKPV